MQSIELSPIGRFVKQPSPTIPKRANPERFTQHPLRRG